MSSHAVLCEPFNWTDLYNAPSAGFFYLWSDRSARVHWRAFSASWPYVEGTANAVNGKVTVPFGAPTPWVRVEVRPDTEALLQVT